MTGPGDFFFSLGSGGDAYLPVIITHERCFFLASSRLFSHSGSKGSLFELFSTFRRRQFPSFTPLERIFFSTRRSRVSALRCRAPLGSVILAGTSSSTWSRARCFPRGALKTPPFSPFSGRMDFPPGRFCLGPASVSSLLLFLSGVE